MENHLEIANKAEVKKLVAKIMVFVMKQNRKTIGLDSAEELGYYIEKCQPEISEFYDAICKAAPEVMEVFTEENSETVIALKNILEVPCRGERISGAYYYFMSECQKSDDMRRTSFKCLEGIYLLNEAIKSGPTVAAPKKTLTKALEALLECKNNSRPDDRPAIIANKAYLELCPVIIIKHVIVSNTEEGSEGIFTLDCDKMPLSPEYIGDFFARDKVMAEHLQRGIGIRNEIAEECIQKILYETGVLCRIEFKQMNDDEKKEAINIHLDKKACDNSANN